MRAKKTIVRAIISPSEGNDKPKWISLLLMMTDSGVVKAIRYKAKSA